MADIAEDQQAAAERIIAEGLTKALGPQPSLSELLANASSSLDTDTSMIVAYAINTYVESMGRIGGRNRFTAGDVTRLFTIINLYLEGGTVKVAKAEDYAPKGRPSR